MLPSLDEGGRVQIRSPEMRAPKICDASAERVALGWWLEYDNCMEASATQSPVSPAAAAIPAEWLAEFEAAARRPLATRMHYSFIHTYEPVMDDATYRSFDTMEEYRRWCDANLPAWLGYGRV